MGSCQVVPELLDVPTKRLKRASSNEAIRLLRAAAEPHLPRMATDGDGIDLGPDGLNIPVASKPIITMPRLATETLVLEHWSVILPNHQLIVTTVSDMIDISRSEQIICHVGVDVRIIVAPLHSGRNAANTADQLFGQGHLGVRIAFDLATISRPCPGRMPCDSRARYAVDISTLRTRAI